MLFRSKSGSVMIDDKVSKEPTVAGVWEDVDCSTEALDASVLFFELGSDAVRDYSVMHPFDLESTYADYAKHAFTISFCDSQQIVEAKVEDIASSTFEIVGYSTSGIYRVSPITYSKSVTVTGITNGKRKVIVSADGTDLVLSVTEYNDVHLGNSPQTIALAAATVPDNANDWLLTQNNVMPYMEYYQHTVADTLKA